MNPTAAASIRAALAILDQPVTRRLRRENSVFDGDMHFLEGNLRDALLRCAEYTSAMEELDANLENHQDGATARYQRATIRAALGRGA